MKQGAHHISRYARLGFIGGVLARAAGIGRDVAMTFALGSAGNVGLFLAALTFIQMPALILGNGAMRASFTATYVRQVYKSKEEGGAFVLGALRFFTYFNWAIVFVIALALFGTLHWADLSTHTRTIIYYLLILLPAYPIYFSTGIHTAYLLSEGVYLLTAAGAAMKKVIWALAALCLYGQTSAKMVAWLGVALLIGYVLNWALLGPPCRRRLPKLSEVKAWTPQIKQCLCLLGWGTIAFGAVQVNIAVSTYMARFIDARAPAYLWYSFRLVAAPFGLFGFALAGAVLPSLARAVEMGSWEAYHKFLAHAQLRAINLAAIATFGLIAMAIPLSSLVYFWGQFTLYDLHRVVECTWALSCGLVPMIASLITVSALFVIGKHRWPVIGFVVGVVANIVLCLMALRTNEPYMICLAVSAGFWIFWIVSRIVLAKHAVPWSALASQAVRSGLVGLVAGAASMAPFFSAWPFNDAPTLWWRLFQFVVQSLIFAAIVWAGKRLWRVVD